MNRGSDSLSRRGRGSGSGRSLPSNMPGRGSDVYGHSQPAQEQSGFEKDMSSQIFEVSTDTLQYSVWNHNNLWLKQLLNFFF